jgi:lysozyme family protein
MNRNFQRALALVLKHEGGYVDHPKDPGGATNKGVTIATFRRYVKKDGTKDDLRRISDADVARIYKRHYWDAVRGDDLPDGLDYATFDFAVNSGTGRAPKYLQRVLGVAQDGVIFTTHPLVILGQARPFGFAGLDQVGQHVVKGEVVFHPVA